MTFTTYILVVEDNLTACEKAKEVLLQKGYKAAVAHSLTDALRLLNNLGERIVGILTDIHLPEKEGASAETPCGLAVVAEAVRRNIPVAVCSDIDHHRALYVKTVIDVLGNGIIPLVMDSKNYQKAAEVLILKLPEGNAKTSKDSKSEPRLLVVTEKLATVYEQLAKEAGFKVVISDNRTAIHKFLEEDIDFAIVDGYTEDVGSSDIQDAYRNLKATAMPHQKIIRCSFESYRHDDFLRLPITAADLQKKLLG